MQTKRLTTCAMLVAINVVLSIITPINLGNFKFTFEAFPILISGILFGPIDGLIVGTIGSSIYQILFSGYGLMITTPLWILPHALSGLIVGLYAKKHNFNLNRKQILIIAICSSIIVTVTNTVAIFIDSKIYGYYTFAYVFGNILMKIVNGTLLAFIYSIILDKIVVQLKKIVK